MPRTFKVTTLWSYNGRKSNHTVTRLVKTYVNKWSYLKTWRHTWDHQLLYEHANPLLGQCLSVTFSLQLEQRQDPEKLVNCLLNVRKAKTHNFCLLGCTDTNQRLLNSFFFRDSDVTMGLPLVPLWNKVQEFMHLTK